MITHVFGDSHAAFCFGAWQGVDVHWLGPVTMYRVGREGAAFVHSRINNYTPSDAILFIFGEIDARCHIGRIADASGTDRQFVIENLVSKYLDSICAISAEFPGSRMVVSCIPPPSDLNHNPDYPVYGTLDDRVYVTQQLNMAIRQHAKNRDVLFLDFFFYFADKNGRLRVERSDGTVHIAPDCSAPIMSRLTALTGHRYGFGPGKAVLVASRLPLRWVLSWVKPPLLCRISHPNISATPLPREAQYDMKREYPVLQATQTKQGIAALPLAVLPSDAER